MVKRAKHAPAPSLATLKRLPKLSKGAVKMLERVHAGIWYPQQFPEAHGFMKELVDAGLVMSMGRVAVLKTAYVPAGTEPPQLEKIPEMPNWIRQVYIERTFDHITSRVKKSKSDVPDKTA